MGALESALRAELPAPLSRYRRLNGRIWCGRFPGRGYAPEGLPALTVEMSRANPFDPHDGCGDGRVNISADGLADMVYNLWDRNPVSVPAGYLKPQGKTNRPPAPSFKTY